MAFRILLLAGLASCGGNGDSRPGEPRLVVLYATCTVNRDCLGPYQPAVDYTPHLDRFAAEAAVFTRHQTEVGSSGPSFATLLTGTAATRHGTYFHPRELPGENYLLAEAFADNGYDTFFWSGHVMASASLGYGQGVPEANIVRMETADFRIQRVQLTAADPVFTGILRRLRRDPDYRAFIQIHFTMTHSLYHTRTTPGERAAFAESHPGRYAGLSDEDIERYIRLYRGNHHALSWNFPEAVDRLELSPGDVAKLARVLDLCYRTSVQALDRHFGAFLEAVRSHDLLDESLIVFTADHGEILYRENALFHWTHGKQLSPEVLLVPLIVRSPGAGVPPRRYDRVTRSMDLFPTLAGLLGLRLPDDVRLDGADLSRAITGEEKAPDLRARSHTSLISVEQLAATPGLSLRDRFHPGHDPRTMWTLIREGDLVFKLQHRGDGTWIARVFDWIRDPRETRDLYDPEDPHHAEMVEALKAYKVSLVEAYPRSGRDLPSEEQRERLRSLGYIN